MEAKERQRYLLFKIVADEKINEHELINTIWRQLFQLYGEFGTSQTGLWLAEYEEDGKFGILRTNVAALQMVRTALATIRKVYGKDCILYVQAVSGTIEALKRKHLR